MSGQAVGTRNMGALGSRTDFNAIAGLGLSVRDTDRAVLATVGRSIASEVWRSKGEVGRRAGDMAGKGEVRGPSERSRGSFNVGDEA